MANEEQMIYCDPNSVSTIYISIFLNSAVPSFAQEKNFRIIMSSHKGPLRTLHPLRPSPAENLYCETIHEPFD